MADFALDMKDVADQLTLQVKFKNVRQWCLRVRLGLWLIRLAAWVMWVNVEVERE